MIPLFRKSKKFNARDFAALAKDGLSVPFGPIIEQLRAAAEECTLPKPLIIFDARAIVNEFSKKKVITDFVAAYVHLSLPDNNAFKAELKREEANGVGAVTKKLKKDSQEMAEVICEGANAVFNNNYYYRALIFSGYSTSCLPALDHLSEAAIAWHEFKHALQDYNTFIPEGELEYLNKTPLRSPLGRRAISYIQAKQLGELGSDLFSMLQTLRMESGHDASDFLSMRSETLCDELVDLSPPREKDKKGVGIFCAVAGYANLIGLKAVQDFVQDIKAEKWPAVHDTLFDTFLEQEKDTEKAALKTDMFLDKMIEAGMKGLSIDEVSDLSDALATQHIMTVEDINAFYTFVCDDVSGEDRKRTLSSKQKDYLHQYGKVLSEGGAGLVSPVASKDTQVTKTTLPSNSL